MAVPFGFLAEAWVDRSISAICGPSGARGDLFVFILFLIWWEVHYVSELLISFSFSISGRIKQSEKPSVKVIWAR